MYLTHIFELNTSVNNVEYSKIFWDIQNIKYTFVK